MTGTPRRKAAAAPRAAGDRRVLAVLRALSDGTRLRIFRRIAAGRGPVCVCELTDRFPVSQPTVSHHLRVLREAGLVTVSRKGTWSYFAPAPGGLDALRGVLGGLDRRARVRRRAAEACR
jgi:ArsR family transcriptional regulator